MTKLLPGDFTNQLIFSFPPLAIEPVLEGYRLTADAKLQGAINLLQNRKILESLGGLGLVILVSSLFFNSINLAILTSIWLILIPIPIFLLVYGCLRLLVDAKFRYKVGAWQGLAPAEIIFSHYPLRVGEDDRLMFRRELKDNFWNHFFNFNHFPDQGSLKVSLICGEQVMYTEGTDNKKEVAIVHEERIYSHSLIGGDRQVKSYFNLHIPAQLIPSFEGKNNQIRWLLKVEESYPQVIEQLITYITFVVDP